MKFKKYKDLTMDECKDICDKYEECYKCPLDISVETCLKSVLQDCHITSLNEILDRKVKVDD